MVRFCSDATRLKLVLANDQAVRDETLISSPEPKAHKVSV